MNVIEQADAIETRLKNMSEHVSLLERELVSLRDRVLELEMRVIDELGPPKEPAR